METGVAYGVSGDLALMTLIFYNLNRNGTTAKAGEHGSWAILSTPENLLSLSLTGHKEVRFHSILQPTNFMCSDVVLTVSKLSFLNLKTTFKISSFPLKIIKTHLLKQAICFK